jgi:hypothetical protein
MAGGRPKSDEKLRFLAKVKVMNSGCHEWQAGFNRGGYGKFQTEGKAAPAHRVAYRLFKQNPEKLNVLHRCDNRKCVNVEHLFLGTIRDNVADMDEKQRRGTKSKLTYADVGVIKSLLNDRYTQQYIAEKFNVNQTTVSRIKLGKTFLFKD